MFSLHSVVHFFLKVFKGSESEFNEFEPRLKSPQKRFKLSTGFNLETLITILSGTDHILAEAQIL